jgi:hypothetical protein
LGVVVQNNDSRPKCFTPKQVLPLISQRNYPYYFYHHIFNQLLIFHSNTMHTKHLLLWAIIPFIFTVSANAQTAQERAKIVAEYAKINPQSKNARLSAENASKKEAASKELRIQAYLKKHPTFKRMFESNGSVYSLKDIDTDGNPIYINTKSNVESGALIKANQLYSGGSIGANIIGQNMVAGVWDIGQVRATHELLSGKVTMQPNQAQTNVGGNDHQTHVTGTMVGKELANKPSARGIAYGATALNYDDKDDVIEMDAFAGLGYLISNHSYGYGNHEGDPIWRFGAYNDESKAWDKIVLDKPNYLPFVAVGNEQNPNSILPFNSQFPQYPNGRYLNGNRSKEGYDMITGASSAKNVMTVGALNGDKAMAGYSNWGPTDDGRVKPEIVTRGTAITSSYFYYNNSVNAPSDTTYVTGNGTSYASPAAAAGALLLQQYHNSLFQKYMKAATLKALMLGTAEDLGQTGPDNKFGWGLLDVEKAARTIKYKSAAGSPTAQTFTDGTSKGAYLEEITYNVPNNNSTELVRNITASGCEPLIASIAWTDDEGTEQVSEDGIDPTTSRLVHNFDFIVRNITTGVEVRAWKPSVMANRTADATLETGWFDGNGNNYKQVKINNPVAGQQYAILVRKSTTSPATAKPFSLIVTGTQLATPTAIAQNFCGSKTVADLVVSSDENIKWYDAATAGNLLSPTTALVSGTYYASQTINGCESPRISVAVTVNPNTTPSVSISPTTVCAGATQMITTTPINGGSATYLWKKNNVNLSTDQNITITNAVAGDVYALTMTPSANQCSSSPTATASLTIGAGCTSTITSIVSGNWESFTTWNLNRLPTAADDVVIDANHTVTVTTPDANAKKIETRNNAKIIYNDSSAKLKLGF